MKKKKLTYSCGNSKSLIILKIKSFFNYYFSMSQQETENCTEKKNNTKAFINENRTLKYEKYDDVIEINDHQNSRYPFSTEFTDDYDHLLRLLKGIIISKEKSLRALALTEVILLENPSDLIPWWYRKEILNEIGFDSVDELRFTDMIMEQGLKSYQAWEHRKWAITKMNHPPDDLSFLFERISEDPRNFHAWSYSIWLAEYHGIYKSIFDMSTYFIKKNRRNGSAWNARLTLLIKMNGDVLNELDFAFNIMGNDGGNESCCNFVRGLIQYKKDLLSLSIQKVESFLQNNKNDKSLYSLYLHLSEMNGDIDKRAEICQKLSFLDPLRKNYWMCVMKNDERFV